MIPLPVILVEFLGAFGLALLGANLLALFRLRRDGAAHAAEPAASGQAVDQRATVPSRMRIVAGIVLGLVVTLWAVASWLEAGYQF